MSESATIHKAKLIQLTNREGQTGSGEVTAHFNPETLAMTIRNSMEEAKRDMTQGRPSQLVASSEVTLAVQLLFDMTMDGQDVRTETAKIAEMMHPGAVVSREEGKRRPSRVQFKWGEFTFEGLITDYSETLDYFSETGVPLRSTVDLSLTKYDAAVPPPGGTAAANSVGAGSAPPTAPVASGDSLDDATSKGAPQIPKDGPAKEKAINEVAGANQIENKKNPGVFELASPEAAWSAGAAAGATGSPLSVSAGVSAGTGFSASAGAGIEFGDPPTAFASGDAGFGLDLGASAGAGIGIGAGGDLAAGASLGIGADGAFAQTGAGAAGGDSLGLETFTNLNPPSASFSAGSSLGGGVSFDAPSLSAGVGAGVSLGGAAGFSAGAGLGGGADILAGANIGGGQIAYVGKEINLADIIFKEEDA